ncbi:NAD-dependent epimerase/dehydratase [Corchorus capsularis]|uniref:NAD-dependent epimerase/dehydratase n=1 Tax=Corchorus capsularis TaxID=210143 RepID=A0A1R3I1R7_COCAP|nr:NAD-dependent epimerase/dehydratase [Corchorus capsularis]
MKREDGNTIDRGRDLKPQRDGFHSGIDGPSEGIPRVLACFSNNLLRGEPLKLVDGGQSQRTFVYIKDAIEAVLLMIVYSKVTTVLRVDYNMLVSVPGWQGDGRVTNSKDGVSLMDDMLLATMFEIEVEESASADNVDLLDKFLPPPQKAKCSEDLQVSLLFMLEIANSLFLDLCEQPVPNCL